VARAEDNWDRLQSIFEEALELSEDERKQFLVSECAGEKALIEDVQSLLASYGPAALELEDSPIQLSTSPDHPVAAAIPADAIDGYEILSEIHRGGQGVVYLAIQHSTKRKVALKVILEGPFLGSAEKRRFEREIEVIGSLQHPGIVPIFDSGIAHHQYYYAMEYIRGQTLNKSVSDRKLSLEQTLKLFATICEAVGYAHQKGIIHRDLKPSNILVDDLGVPRVLDFGLAKKEGSHFETNGQPVLVSATGQIMGTLAYMSPEQTKGIPHLVDIRSDVYSLGVILYELLTGEMPYDLHHSMQENLSTIQHAEPRQFRSNGQRINIDLRTIILKAMSKESSRRYATAGTLGEEVARYLGGQPIEARRDNALYVLRRTMRRHFVVATAVFTFLALLAVFSVVSWTLYVDARRSQRGEELTAEKYKVERDRASSNARKLMQTLYFTEMNLAAQRMQGPGGVGKVREILARWHPDRAGLDLRGWEWYRLLAFSRRERFVFNGHSESVWGVDWRPDGSRAASVSVDGTMRIWDLATGRQADTIESVSLRSIDWSPDGKQIATSGFGGSVYLWDAESRQQVIQLRGHTEGVPVTCVRWSLDGSRLVSSSRNGELIVWDASSGKILNQMDTRSNRLVTVCWNPAGDRVATTLNGRLCVLDPITEDRVWITRQELGAIESIAWSPDAKRIAASGKDTQISIFDSTKGKLLRVLDSKSAGTIWAVCWSPDSTRLAAACGDCVVRVWDVDSDHVQLLNGHTAPPISLEWDSSGERIVSSGLDRSVRVWDIEAADKTGTIGSVSTHVSDIDWNSDGTCLASCGHDNFVRIWNITSGELSLALDGNDQNDGRANLTKVRWSPDDLRLAAAGQFDSVYIWDAATGAMLHRLRGHLDRSISLAWHPDRDLLAVGESEGAVRIWDSASGNPLARLPGPSAVRAVAWSPDGLRLASVSSNEDGPVVFVRSVNDWAIETTLNGHTKQINSISWSPGGSELVTGSDDGTIRVWDVATGLALTEPMSPGAFVTSTDWSPDSVRPRIIAAVNTGQVYLYDRNSSKLAMTLETPFLNISSVQWSPDGKQLAASNGNTISLWDATIGYQPPNGPDSWTSFDTDGWTNASPDVP
jgi:eukaryotic-like serine/threonine-protein kinase